MVEQISQMALEKLRDLLIEEVKFLSGVGGQVEEVERELRTIHCFLKDADSRPDRYNSATVSNLITELKEIAYKAENVLEKYAIEVASKRRGRNLKKKLKRYACILSECVSVHQVGKDVEAIRSRMATLSSKVESMPLIGETSSNDQQLLMRQTYGHQVEKQFVGMEKDIEQLVSLVMDDEGSNPVISIYGMGGLGKTTLARKIYQHSDLKTCFEARAWVCISQQFQAKTALQQILKQLLSGEKKDEIEKMDESELVRELYNVQMQKKCFVVIDDIWKTDHWNFLKSAFPIAEANCKVLLTTRDKRIASEECLYELNYLTEEQGWELLRKIALPQGVKTELGEYEAIGRKIVQKCGRLPLAISAVGGILRHQVSSSKWQSVSNNIDSYLSHGEGVEENTRVTQVLDLSYNSLPFYLKPCFLYLGCFPEDKIVDTERLYLLWIAEGMVSSEDKGRNESLRDVAKRYLNELAFRCMVQVEVIEDLPFRSVFFQQTFRIHETCRLHDLMRDLCLRKGEQERFLKVVDLFKGTRHVPSNDAAIIPRLSVHVDEHLDDNFKEREKVIESLRSLLVLGESQYGNSKVGSKHSLTNSTKLKLLMLENCDFENKKLPSKLRKLIHLRYLSLFGSVVDELPLFVGDFPYLQTLDLRVEIRMRLPNVICKMKRLRHLFMNYNGRGIIGNSEDKFRLDGLEELETLVGFSSKCDCIEDIPKLTNLQRLNAHILNDEGLSIIVDHINSNQNRLCETNLDFQDCHFTLDLLMKLFMSPSLVRLCFWTGTLDCNLPCYEPSMCTNLVCLTFHDYEIEGDVMETFGKFPMLKSLWLRIKQQKNLVNGEMICRANSFPQLKTLQLSNLKNLEKWRVDEGAMPNLSSLTIRWCDKLEMIPDGLRYITTLQELTVHAHKEFNDRLRVVDGVPGPDCYKVSHVPSISLQDYSDEFR